MGLNPGPLSDRNVRLFVAVTAVVGFGSTAMSLVSSVWVFSLTGSASLASLSGLCVYAPSLAGPLIGTVVDRLPRRPLLLWTNTLMAGALVSLLAVRSAADVWLIFAVMLAYGTTVVLADAAESAIVSAVVPAAWLGRVNSLRMSVQEGLKLVAPVAGAALFVAAGGPAVAALAATALLVGAVLYARIHYRQSAPVPGPAAGVFARTVQGVRTLFDRAELRTVVLAASAVMAAGGLASAAMLLVITQDLHRAPAFAGVLATAQGAGSIAGSVLCGRLLDRRGERLTAAWGAGLFAAGTLALTVPSTAVVLLARMVFGVGLPWMVVAAFTAVQRHTDEAAIGRVAASAGTLIFGPVALAIPLGAGLITLVDHRAVLAVTALVATGTAGTLVAGARRRPAATLTAVTAAEPP